MNQVKQKIKSVTIANEAGFGDSFEVGINGITEIKIGSRQYSNDGFVDVIIVMKGNVVVEEISMRTPYMLGYMEEIDNTY